MPVAISAQNLALTSTPHWKQTLPVPIVHHVIRAIVPTVSTAHRPISKTPYTETLNPENPAVERNRLRAETTVVQGIFTELARAGMHNHRSGRKPVWPGASGYMRRQMVAAG